MASYNPPKKNAEYIFYVGLISRNTGQLQTNPTLAEGDVKVSSDGGAFGNITTLPTVTPAGGAAVKVTLSATEMNADNVAVVFQDAAGTEWDDVAFAIPTASKQFDDIAPLADIVDGVLDEVVDSTSHFTSDTVGETLTIIRGLMQQNYVIDTTTYDANGFMTAARIRIFATKAAANAATDGGSGEGEIATFAVTGTPESSPTTVTKIGKVVRES